MPTTTTVEAPAAPAAEKPRNGYGLRLTTFNILSSSIARGGIDRATRAARWVQDQGADAAAFQEVAKDQLRQMQTVMPKYSFFPRRALGTRGSAIQIAWNTRTVKKMETGYIMRPFLGWARPIPYVRLRDRETGRGFWVVAIHNAPGGQEHERDVSTAAEVKLIKKLAAQRDRPVFVIGDVNERSEFCQKVAGATSLISMNGGSEKNPCPVPRFGGPDWMLGSGADSRTSRRSTTASATTPRSPRAPGCRRRTEPPALTHDRPARAQLGRASSMCCVSVSSGLAGRGGRCGAATGARTATTVGARHHGLVAGGSGLGLAGRLLRRRRTATGPAAVAVVVAAAGGRSEGPCRHGGHDRCRGPRAACARPGRRRRCGPWCPAGMPWSWNRCSDVE